MQYYYVAYKRRTDAIEFEGYYIEEKMKDLANDKEVVILALTGGFSLENVQEQAVKNGLNIIS